MSKKAQIEKWIVLLIIIIVGAVLLVYLFAAGLLPKAFSSIMGQLKPPSVP